MLTIFRTPPPLLPFNVFNELWTYFLKKVIVDITELLVDLFFYCERVEEYIRFILFSLSDFIKLTLEYEPLR